MKRTINFNKDKNKNYVFKEINSKNKLIINCIDKILSGKELYDTFFKNSKFNKGDTFKLDIKIKNPTSTEKHIFEKIEELFIDIQNELNK